MAPSVYYEVGEQLSKLGSNEIKMRSQKEQLQDQIAGLKKRTAEIEEALSLLEKYPDMERLLTLMRSF